MTVLKILSFAIVNCCCALLLLLLIIVQPAYCCYCSSPRLAYCYCCLGVTPPPPPQARARVAAAPLLPHPGPTQEKQRFFLRAVLMIQDMRNYALPCAFDPSITVDPLQHLSTRPSAYKPCEPREGRGVFRDTCCSSPAPRRQTSQTACTLRWRGERMGRTHRG